MPCVSILMLIPYFISPYVITMMLITSCPNVLTIFSFVVISASLNTIVVFCIHMVHFQTRYRTAAVIFRAAGFIYTVIRSLSSRAYAVEYAHYAMSSTDNDNCNKHQYNHKWTNSTQLCFRVSIRLKGIRSCGGYHNLGQKCFCCCLWYYWL